MARRAMSGAPERVRSDTRLLTHPGVPREDPGTKALARCEHRVPPPPLVGCKGEGSRCVLDLKRENPRYEMTMKTKP